MGQPDPKQLSDGELDDFERALLESVSDDDPPHDGRKKTLAALGLSASSAATTQQRGRSTKQLWTELSKGKLVVLGVVALGAGLAITKFESAEIAASKREAAKLEDHEATVAPAESTSNPPSGAASEAPAVPAAPVARTTPAAQAAPVTPEMLPSAARSASIASRPPAPSNAVAESTLAREIAALEAARSELSRGNATTVLRLLDAYDKEFPRGSFSVEVAALRIEALAREGRVAEVDRLAAAFLSANPVSVYTRRVEEAQARARRVARPEGGRALEDARRGDP